MVLALHDRVGVGGTGLTPSFRLQIQDRVVELLRKHRHLLSNYCVPTEKEMGPGATGRETKDADAGALE